MALVQGRARNRSPCQRSLLSPLPENTHQDIDQSPLCPWKVTVSPHRKDLPAWDRTFDAVYHRHAAGQNVVKSEVRFRDALEQFFEDRDREKPNFGYFRLPDSVRFRICQLVMEPHLTGKPVRLNRGSFNRNCWRHDDLQSAKTALLPLADCWEVSFAFRADILVAFLVEVRLHVTFSPYVGSRLNPLATTWLNQYGRYAENLVVEVDMTHLGCGPATDASDLYPGVEYIDELLEKFVESQCARSTSRPLDSLVLLCRRYYGLRDEVQSTSFMIERPTTGMSVAGRSSSASTYSRMSQRSDPFSNPEVTKQNSHELIRAASVPPIRGRPFWNTSPGSVADSSTDDSEDITTSDARQTGSMGPTSSLMLSYQEHYCPNSYLDACDILLELSGRVNSLRICGFSQEYATSFIYAMFPSARTQTKQCCYRVAPSTVWPRLSGQKSYVDSGDGSTTLDEHDAAPVARHDSAWKGCVQLPPPIIDTDDNLFLPPVVGALQKSRMALSSIDDSLTYGSESTTGKRVDKNRIQKLLSYGKSTTIRKRVFTKEASATL
ncbi:hypothetical protein B0J13DRAFT_61170 [Dactylonectria estremocensis]|uniref:Uncharacterized protein n=1 Tax=Dactylonectria estremocensis TaxID=1079267 RepID=A0A9P9EN31_9HYPO|nr:hypothetical protein B0J13DRAFT_61170 [Dactylonectria estremocensis]